jgi:hypothetical protein
MKWFDDIKELLADALIVAFAGLWLAVFTGLWFNPRVNFLEDNLWVRGAETGMLVLIIVLGIERLIDDFRRR